MDAVATTSSADSSRYSAHPAGSCAPPCRDQRRRPSSDFHTLQVWSREVLRKSPSGRAVSVRTSPSWP